MHDMSHIMTIAVSLLHTSEMVAWTFIWGIYIPNVSKTHL